MFEAPGPGQWRLDRSHFDSGMTSISEELMGGAVERAYRKLFALMGVPMDSIQFRSVNGFPYGRSAPLSEPRDTNRQPPPWLLKLIVRAHPELRRRNRAAASFLANPGFEDVVHQWRTEIRPRLLARNTAFQDVDLAGLGSEELAGHIADLMEYTSSTLEEHHRLHGYDLFPIAQLVGACTQWGLETSAVLATLVGASPSTTEPLEHALRIRTMLDEAGVEPTTLEDIRAASPEIKAELDIYVARHGSVLFSSYDIDAPTLAERPDVLLRSITSSVPLTEVEAKAQRHADEVRQSVPHEHHKQFDVLLNEARDAMDMRDDNGPITVEWPMGLLRLALLEAGRRGLAAGTIADADHVFELRCAEIGLWIRRGGSPSAEALAERAALRSSNRSLDPPDRLGPDQPEPDLDVLPASMAEMLGTMITLGDHLLTPDEVTGLDETTMHGVGIGHEPFEGVARLANSADEAIDALQDGEILVTRATSPAFNLVLTIAGGLITAEGGAMAHAAVLARELGLPAVVGAVGCLDKIANGDRIRLDPQQGVVTVLGPSG